MSTPEKKIPPLQKPKPVDLTELFSAPLVKAPQNVLPQQDVSKVTLPRVIKPPQNILAQPDVTRVGVPELKEPRMIPLDPREEETQRKELTAIYEAKLPKPDLGTRIQKNVNIPEAVKTKLLNILVPTEEGVKGSVSRPLRTIQEKQESIDKLTDLGKLFFNPSNPLESIEGPAKAIPSVFGAIKDIVEKSGKTADVPSHLMETYVKDKLKASSLVPVNWVDSEHGSQFIKAALGEISDALSVNVELEKAAFLKAAPNVSLNIKKAGNTNYYDVEIGGKTISTWKTGKGKYFVDDVYFKQKYPFFDTIEEAGEFIQKTENEYLSTLPQEIINVFKTTPGIDWNVKKLQGSKGEVTKYTAKISEDQKIVLLDQNDDQFFVSSQGFEEPTMSFNSLDEATQYVNALMGAKSKSDVIDYANLTPEQSSFLTKEQKIFVTQYPKQGSTWDPRITGDPIEDLNLLKDTEIDFLQKLAYQIQEGHVPPEWVDKTLPPWQQLAKLNFSESTGSIYDQWARVPTNHLNALRSYMLGLKKIDPEVESTHYIIREWMKDSQTTKTIANQILNGEYKDIPAFRGTLGILNAIDREPPTAGYLVRGWHSKGSPTQSELREKLTSRFQKGKEVDIPISSFSPSMEVADGFTGSPIHTYFHVSPGAKALKIQNFAHPDHYGEKEWITGGRFLVDDIIWSKAHDGLPRIDIQLTQKGFFNVPEIKKP